MGVPIQYGLCRGGPWNKKHLADARTWYEVMIDPTGAEKPWVGQQQATKARPGKMGRYIWNEEDKAWDWKLPGEA